MVGEWTGDVNGDAYSDLLIGAPCYISENGYCGAGRSYAVFGNKDISGGGSTVLLGNLNGANGFKLDGEVNGDYSGGSVSAAGDINGDGYGDLLIGSALHNSNSGRSYVVWGGPSVGKGEIISLSGLTGSKGFKIDGEVSGDGSGYSVSVAGDINGDGYGDLLIALRTMIITGAAVMWSLVVRMWVATALSPCPVLMASTGLNSMVKSAAMRTVIRSARRAISMRTVVTIWL